MAQQQPDLEPHARGLGETASGITGWVWYQVEPVVKQQICSPENYAKVSSITTAELAARIDDILTPFAATVTDALPVALKLLTPLLPLLHKLIANIIAQELEQAGTNDWAAYCGLPNHRSSAVAAVAG